MNIKKPIKNYFLNDKDIICAYLFGSFSKKKENKFSDIDIAVLFSNEVKEKEYTNRKLNIMDSLCETFDKNIDIVVLNNASSFLKYQIIKNGIRIFEQPNRAGHGFEARSVIEYLDFLPTRKRLEKALLNNIKEA